MRIIKKGDTVLATKPIKTGRREYKENEEFVVQFVNHCAINCVSVLDGTRVLGVPRQFKLKEDTMYEEMKRALRLKRGEHIVGSIDKQTGSLSFSTNPSNHGTSFHKALAEAKRLAAIETGKKFVVVEVKAIASAVDIVVE